MTKFTFIDKARRCIFTVGFVFLTLKLFKAVVFNWIVTLLPFLLLALFEVAFFVWGYIIYRKYLRKNG